MRDTVRHVLLPLWNCWYFLTLYANAADYQGVVRTDSTNVLDRYVLAKTRALVADMTEALDGYDLFGACQVVREHLDVLTNWYVRRSRDRFWAGDHDAIDTMHTVLSVLVRVSAPLLPLLSEEIYGGLHGTGGEAGATSVHLTDWPDLEELPADDDLVDTMDLVRDVCSATLSVRKAHQRRVRLPLNSVTIAAADAHRLGDFVDVIADEVNVRRVELTTDVASVATERLQLVPAKLGPRLGKDVQRVITAHKAGDWSVAGDVVTVGGVVLEPGEYTLDLVASGDQASAGLGAHAGVIALDVEVNEELEVEGRARDLVRLVQQARREADLAVSDRIELTVRAPAEWIAAITAHRELIAAETLATELHTEASGPDEGTEPVITVAVAR
jgi:isoleucyl-tRNA synthetase